MYCAKCGKENKDGNLYCNECGNKLDEVIDKHEIVDKKEENIKRKLNPKVVLGIIILIVIGAGITVFLANKSKISQGDTSSNINNEETAIIQSNTSSNLNNTEEEKQVKQTEYQNKLQEYYSYYEKLSSDYSVNTLQESLNGIENILSEMKENYGEDNRFFVEMKSKYTIPKWKVEYKKLLLSKDSGYDFGNDNGFTLLDINQDGIPELIISYKKKLESSEIGVCYKVFTINESNELVCLNDLEDGGHHQIYSTTFGYDNENSCILKCFEGGASGGTWNIITKYEIQDSKLVESKLHSVEYNGINGGSYKYKNYVNGEESIINSDAYDTYCNKFRNEVTKFNLHSVTNVEVNTIINNLDRAN